MAASDLGPWQPFTVGEAARLLAGLAAPWWIAGGWALDLFVGRQTRAHDDLDVEVLRRDQLVLQRHLAGWDLWLAADGVLRPWPPGEPLAGGSTSVWARPSAAGPWTVQFYFADAEADHWLYRRDRRVTRPIPVLGRRTGEGVPYLAPEVQLLYSSAGRREKNEADFALVRPLLAEAQARWLAGALALAHPGHRWSARLRVGRDAT
jgi:hypothetical protein